MLIILLVLFNGLSYGDGLQNIALGKEAYQSDTRYNDVAGKSVDGDTSQNFGHGSCSHTWTADGAWWEVDLAGLLSDVQLYIGYGHDDYVLRGYHPGAIGSTYTFQMTSNVYGRWVRITRDNDPGNLHMCEVQVYGNLTRKMRLQLMSNLSGIGNVLKSQTTASTVHCSSLCKATSKCAGVNYNTISGTCELLDTTSSMTDTTNNTYFYKYP